VKVEACGVHSNCGWHSHKHLRQLGVIICYRLLARKQLDIFPEIESYTQFLRLVAGKSHGRTRSARNNYSLQTSVVSQNGSQILYIPMLSNMKGSLNLLMISWERRDPTRIGPYALRGCLHPRTTRHTTLKAITSELTNTDDLHRFSNTLTQASESVEGFRRNLEHDISAQLRSLGLSFEEPKNSGTKWIKLRIEPRRSYGTISDKQRYLKSSVAF
jgi:hypothetical protein